MYEDTILGKSVYRIPKVGWPTLILNNFLLQKHTMLLYYLFGLFVLGVGYVTS